MQLIVFAWFGLIASLILICGVLFSITKFSGMKHESFSAFNHFISELGDPRFAKHHFLFNLSLFSGGLLLIPFIIGLGLYFNTIFGFIVMIVGIFGVISCALIGVFPENKVRLHFNVAGCFFIGLILLMILFAILIYINQTPLFPTWVIIITIIVLIISSLFLIDTVLLDKEELKRTDEPWNWGENERPKFWLNPFLEWWSYFAMVGWLLFLVILCL
jgi:hypothetical membrane protein